MFSNSGLRLRSKRRASSIRPAVISPRTICPWSLVSPRNAQLSSSRCYQTNRYHLRPEVPASLVKIRSHLSLPLEVPSPPLPILEGYLGRYHQRADQPRLQARRVSSKSCRSFQSLAQVPAERATRRSRVVPPLRLLRWSQARLRRRLRNRCSNRCSKLFRPSQRIRTEVFNYKRPSDSTLSPASHYSRRRLCRLRQRRR